MTPTYPTIVKGWPPNISAIRARFPFVHKRVLFSYDPYIYCPSGEEIPDHLIEHEVTHHLQQRSVGGPEIWWERYLSDDAFLIEQEISAYHNQYEFFCKTESNLKKRYLFLLACATALSSPLYGRSIGKAVALFRIKLNQ